MNLRHITPADSQEWERLRRTLWPRASHLAEVEALFHGTLTEPEAVVVAEDETGAMIGFMELSQRKDLTGTEGELTGYIEGLYVIPQYRSTGLVRKFLGAAKDWSQKEGCAFFASDRMDRIIFDKSYPGASAGAGQAGTPAEAA